MKWVIVLIIAVIGYHCHGQTLKDIFLALPGDSFGLSRAQRDSLVNAYVVNKNGSLQIGSQKHSLTLYKPENGFLMVVPLLSEMSHTLVYWNLSPTEKLVGITSESCGGACDQTITFYRYSKSALENLDLRKVLPVLSFSDFVDIEKMRKDGIDTKAEESTFNSYDLLYELPLTGKNIIVECQYTDIVIDETMAAKYSKGSKIELIWNNGHFKKGELIK